ncbi:branched-chain amino acid ABC transporter permease [Ruania halotolerans]|uniref:branched-chain amino acid ABC transporter permease n=1 Tax=Ruania halotolerans TaxID=2897773 RepID=UPI001E2B427D|nr:branched-chain amino acid ABC transporter permease [Ruania halotolerans]UFU07982.1 branched-chain amino acid ABC transporter permease [Ruania halotolerans]
MPSVSETTPRLRARALQASTSRWRPVIAIVIALAVLALWPTIAPNPYMVSAGVVVLNYAVFATAWNIMGGFTGYISLGHAAFFGLGAYGTGLLVIHTEMYFLLAAVLAMVATVIIALPVGLAALRVRGASFVIVTIALVLVLQLVFQSWGAVTGGSDGFVVPRPFPDMLRPEHHETFFYLFLGLLAVTMAVWTLIDRSRLGAALKGVREDEDKAESLGSPTMRLKLVAFLISAAFTSLAGAFYGLWFGDLDPIFQFDIVLGSTVVLMALLGGIRYLFGPLLGALVIGAALEYFVLNYGDTQFHLIATGLLLALVVLFLPDGVLTGVAQLRARLQPQAASIREVSAEDLRAEQDRSDPGAQESDRDARTEESP